MKMIEILVNDKENRLVSKRREEKKKDQTSFDVTLALLIVCLIDPLSCFLSAFLSVSQLCPDFYPPISIEDEEKRRRKKKMRHISGIFFTLTSSITLTTNNNQVLTRDRKKGCY
jgi:hypothetical protein